VNAKELRVSVIIPTYNRYELLSRAIKSLLLQSLRVDEIIVVDDGSIDHTSNIREDFPQIRYFYQNNSGVSAARNLGIRNAKHEWLAFLDSDDVWHQEKLHKQVAFHKANPEILMSYTAERWVRNATEVKIPKKYKKIGENLFKENLSYCNIAPSSVMLHRRVLEDVGLFNETLRVCEDYDLWLRILRSYEVGLIHDKLITKYAGHDVQLGFAKNMDLIRIEVLQNLLKESNSLEMRALIEEELSMKCLRRLSK